MFIPGFFGVIILGVVVVIWLIVIVIVVSSVIILISIGVPIVVILIGIAVVILISIIGVLIALGAVVFSRILMIVAVHLDAFDVFPSRLISVFQVFPFFELRFEIPDVTTKGFFAHFSMTGIVVQPNTAVTLPGIPFPLMGCLLFSGVVGFLVAFVVRIGIEGPMGLGISVLYKKAQEDYG